jgi:hypothetical protein
MVLFYYLENFVSYPGFTHVTYVSIWHVFHDMKLYLINIIFSSLQLMDSDYFLKRLTYFKSSLIDMYFICRL